ncbi:MAG: glycoside hydrolase family 113, partial [Flavobacteriales bacterium]
ILSFSQKMNGISVHGEKFKPEFENFKHFKTSNANWVSVQAFCFIKSDTSGVDFNRQNYWYSQTLKGITTYIRNAKKNKFKVFLKPHTISQFGNVWSGNFNCTKEKDWKKLETTYSTYILTLAKIAKKEKVEAMAIGVEIQNFFAKRKSFVLKLIKDIRKVYNGKLTYCANWDEYNQVKFWKELDFIGIDSYFTISNEKTPSVETCSKNLKPINAALAKLAKKVNKKIVFTEFGFQSRDYTGYQPWNWEGNKKSFVNMTAQANSYQAVFETFWSESWFMGGFSWKWHLDYSKSGGYFDNSYTPQNKPAEKVISNYYSMFS